MQTPILSSAFVTLLSTVGISAAWASDAFLDDTTRREITAEPPTGSTVAHQEPRLGVPTFVWGWRNDPGPSPKDRGLDAVGAARAHFARHAGLYRLQGGQAADARVLDVQAGPEGAVIVRFGAEVNGYPVLRDRLSVIMTQELRLVAISGYLSPYAFQPPAPFVLSAARAWSAAAQDLQLGAKDELPKEARVEQAYLGLADRLEPAWTIQVGEQLRVISGVDGKVLVRQSLAYAHSYGYRVYADHRDADAPADDPSGGSYLPHPTSRFESLGEGATTADLVYLESGPVGPGDEWLPARANDLIGNAVAAYVDQAEPDGLDLGDIMPVQNAPDTFDYPYDPARDPRATAVQAAAAATQLFYAGNHFHDVWYAAGFTELMGNAQYDLLGRGGRGGDRLLLEAESREDGSLARIVVPPDGSSPRLETFLSRREASVEAFGWGAALLAHRYFAGLTEVGVSEFHVDAELVLADDGLDSPELGCAPYLEPSAYLGKIALVREGDCSVADKALFAQLAGAAALVVVAADPGWVPPHYAGTTPFLSIPVVSLLASEGGPLMDAVSSGSQVGLELVQRPSERRDAAFDRTVVDHELGHYLSARLVGDGLGLANPQGRALAEGWSDFVALLGAVRPDDVLADDFGGLYPVAGYASFDRYFGARRVPYSVDTSADPLSYGHLAPGATLPADVPQQGVGDAYHQAGEVWASMLWETAVAFFRDRPRLDFETARRRLRAHLVRALSVTPVDPTMLEARDAFLAVALAADPADYARAVEAFARRGAGQRASGPERSTDDFGAVVENFDANNGWELVDAYFEDVPGYCDRDGILDDGENGTLVLTLKNVGIETLASTELTLGSDLPALLFTPATVVVPPVAPWRTTEVRVPASLAGDASRTRVQLKVTACDPALLELQALSAVVPINQDPVASTGDDFEGRSSVWTADRDKNLPWVEGWTRVLDEHANRSYFAATPDRVADQYLVSPPLAVRKGQDFSFEFSHRYAFADGDAAVVELSGDRGATWTDLGSAMSPGYNGIVASGILAGRPAFVGLNAQLPAREKNSVNLGMSYGGMTVLVRFRHASDGSTAWWGWDVDDVRFSGVVGTPFTELVADNFICANRPPLAVAPPMKIVPERAIIRFDFGLSRDPDGDPLTFQIQQVQGPGAQLNPASFVAPNVAMDTVVGFRVVAFDGQLASAPVVHRFLVRNIDPRPVVQLPRPSLARPQLK